MSDSHHPYPEPRPGSTLRRLLRQAGILLSGQAVSAGLSILTLIVTARALGETVFGVLVLIQAYARFVDALINFQSWQAGIKFGADALARKDRDSFMRVIRACATLDAATAVLAGVIAVSGAWLVAEMNDWDAQTRWVTVGYCLVVFTNLSGTPTAVLRLFDRFKSLATVSAVSAALKFFATLGAWLGGLGIIGFVAAWMIGDMVLYLGTTWLGERELRRRGYGRWWKVPLAGVRAEHEGIVKFLMTTNLTSSVKLAGREVTMLLVGGMVSPAAAGMLKVAKTFTRVLNLLADSIEQVIYPELVRRWAASDYAGFARALVRSGMIGAPIGVGIWIGFFLMGRPIIAMSFGPDFFDAYLLTLILMVSVVVILTGIGLRSAVLAMGRADKVMWVHLASQVTQLSALPMLLSLYGVVGACLANVLMMSVWFVGMSAMVRSGIKASGAGGDVATAEGSARP